VDRGERLATRVVRVGPDIQTYWWPDVNPFETTVGKQRRRCSYGLPGREVHIVCRHRELTGAHPRLQQTRVDVHQGGPAEAGQQLGIDRVVEVQEQVGPL